MDRFEDFKKDFDFDVSKDHLGDGSSGNVFKAWDKEKSRYIALKIVNYKNSQLGKYTLKAEVKNAKSVRNKKNIALYERCITLKSETGIVDVAIMQLYENGNMKSYLKKHHLPMQVKERVIMGIINGLDQIHYHEIIHRDLKPENILIAVTPRSEVIPKIADFGLSKKSKKKDQPGFSHSFKAGTIAYSSPEQLKDDTEILDYNTDLWSLGVIMYEILVGVNPFTQNIDKGIPFEARNRIVMKRINEREIPADIEKISSPYREIIEQCIIIDPLKRIGSIKAIKDILTQYDKLTVDDAAGPGQVEERDALQVIDYEDTIEPNPLWRRLSANWKMLPGVSLILLVSLSAGYYFLKRAQRDMQHQSVPPITVANTGNTESDSIANNIQTDSVGGVIDSSFIKGYQDTDWFRKYDSLRRKMWTAHFRKRYIMAKELAQQALEQLQPVAGKEKVAIADFIEKNEVFLNQNNGPKKEDAMKLASDADFIYMSDPQKAVDNYIQANKLYPGAGMSGYRLFLNWGKKQFTLWGNCDGCKTEPACKTEVVYRMKAALKINPGGAEAKKILQCLID